MLFEHRYAGSSAVRQDDAATAMSFAPDTLREPTYFRGTIAKQLEFREAISALHDVVTSDLRFIPKDRTSYFAWREQQSYVDLAQVTRDQARVSQEIATLQQELSTLEARTAKRGAGFYAARQKYFNYLYNRDKELWFKLDPVITVHPDQVFFECFSKDESSYGRVAASYEVFDQLGERANGTTNIDYSEKLYGEFQKIRSYKTTTLDVDPGGFNVQTSMEDSYREVKIDLPDSWVRGFLQVSSAATLPAHVVELHPMDVHNLCLMLRRNKELFGPRSLRFQLRPGAPVTVVLDPWGTKLDCPRSRYLDSRPGATGDTEIRVWGRRRLYILERLLPRARRVRLFLLGTGLPTFWVVDLGELSFTLGLSGWTSNNWSEAGNFDLMVAREEVDDITRQRVFAELGQTWLATPDELARRTGLDTPVVASALAGWVQAGRAIYDLDRAVYRKRELTREPLPIEKLRFANEREEAAAALLHDGKIAIDRAETVDGGLRLAGRVRVEGVRRHPSERLRRTDPKTFAPQLTFDAERRLIAGECSCDYFIRNRLHRGPCEHMLALRAAHRRGISDAITFDAAGPAPARDVAQDRESFQAAFRRAVMRAAELRAAGRIPDAIQELERISRLAPPDSDEHARLQEVIAESRLDAGDHQAAREAADRALRRFPASALALRVKRDALVQLDEVPLAIQAARLLAGVEGTAERWSELVRLCHQIEDWGAMLAFAEEGLRAHPKTPRLVAARDVARHHAPDGSAPPPPADATPAKASWWRRAVDKLTGKAPRLDDAAAVSLDTRLAAIADELSRRYTVTDRVALLQVLRVAHAAAEHTDGKVMAMVAAVRTGELVSNLGSDQELIALLRRALN